MKYLAKLFNVGKGCVAGIVQYYTWKHLPDIHNEPIRMTVEIGKLKHTFEIFNGRQNKFTRNEPRS